MSLFPPPQVTWKPAAPMLKIAGAKHLPSPVTLPVVVVQTSRRGGANGNYRPQLARLAPGRESRQLPRGANLFHRIMVKSYLAREEANSTLWHELGHAMQAERLWREFMDHGGERNSLKLLDAWKDYTRGQRAYSYDERPIEVEAREISQRLRDTFDLTAMNRVYA